jgi:hypothetical protein
MLTVEERALVTDLQDKIIELLVLKQEAWANEDTPVVKRLQRNIERLRVECTDIRRSAE